jgi:hypothetical protein
MYTIVAYYINCDGVEASGMCRILIISAGSTVVPALWFNCNIAPAMGWLWDFYAYEAKTYNDIPGALYDISCHKQQNSHASHPRPRLAVVILIVIVLTSRGVLLSMGIVRESKEYPTCLSQYESSLERDKKTSPDSIAFL